MRPGIPPQRQDSAWQLPQGDPSRAFALVALRRRVDEHIQYALNLAARGAVYSARAEFTKAFDLVAQSLDVDEGGTTHRSALQAGLQAFQEAADFLPAGTSPEAHGEFAVLIASHRTPILKLADPARIVPTAAMQAYYAYATEQLALAGGHEPAAALALYSWARVEAMPNAAEARVANNLGEPKAIALQRAALMVDSNNFLAANELGVLLARYGRMNEAKQVLQHSVALSRRPETWYNLSIVHRNLGENAAAQQAYANYQVLAAGSGESSAPASRGAGGTIRWVDFQGFVRDSGPDELSTLATNPGRSANAAAASKIPSAAENPLGFIHSWLKPKASADSVPARGTARPDQTADRTPAGQ